MGGRGGRAIFGGKLEDGRLRDARLLLTPPGGMDEERKVNAGKSVFVDSELSPLIPPAPASDSSMDDCNSSVPCSSCIVLS